MFLVRPCRFQSNPLTAASNAFQANAPWPDLQHSNALAQAMFVGLVSKLRAVGFECIVFDDIPEPHTPDSIFPNNWLSLHADGTVVLYPMEAANRRPERRDDILESLERHHGFTIKRRIDFSHYERSEQFLEGTGALVLDRVNRVAYVSMSTRADAHVARQFAARLGYTPILFESADSQRQAIYHTNVMMSVGKSVAIVCGESVNPQQRPALMGQLANNAKTVVDISLEQVGAFAGNMLELANSDGDALIAMSQQALDCLEAGQRKLLSAHADLVASPIDLIEAQSGGSVRCMLAEVHLPRAA